MPFFTPSKHEELNINYDLYQPVAVYYYTSSEGEATPLKFKYETPECTIETVEISQIQNRKSIRNGYSYTCLCYSYGRPRQVVLYFYIDKMMWVMQKY